MNLPIRNAKDFWTGIIYLAIGTAAVLMSKDYGMGTALKMGPGYFPVVLGCTLGFIGVVSLIRSFIVPGEPVGRFAIQAIALVIGAVALGAFLMRTGGLVVALPVVVLISAYASKRFQWRATFLLAAGLTLFCGLVFIKGLGIPIPLVGPWLGG